ncbi:MAG: glycosyltransferase family 39 protein [Candidatus Omnitrophica bacterium]|nr:glycosyltransferase family 39 protein [Candidatus Omnitrophota bacterium]
MDFLPILAPAICALTLIYLSAQKFNYSLYLPSMSRVIYVPLYFWILYITYMAITHRVFLKGSIKTSKYMGQGVLAGFFLNLYILLGNLIFALFRDQGQLSTVYFNYIQVVFLVTTAGLMIVTAKNIFLRDERGVRGKFLYIQFFVAAAYFICLGLIKGHPVFAVLAALSGAAGIALHGAEIRAFHRYYSGIIENRRLILATIFLIAFAIRLIFGFILVHKTTHSSYGYDGYLYASDDGLTYDPVANKILKDPSVIQRGEIELWGNWDCFYSVFLAVVYKIFGRNFYVVVLIQSALGALIPLSVFLIGELLFSKTVGLIAALAVAFKGGLIMESCYMGHEAVWLPLLYLFILILTRYYKRPERSSFPADILMGAVLGFISLFRSLYFYFAPFLCIWEMAFFRHIKITRRILHLVIVLVCSACIVAGGAHIFNNKMRLLNRDKANMLWSTSREVSPPFQNIGNERLEALGINFFRDIKGSIAVIAKDPVKIISLAAEIYPLRIIAYFESCQFGFFDPIYMLNPTKAKNEFASTLEFYFTLFFVVGLGVCFATKGVVRSPIFLLLVFHTLFLAVLLFHPAPRLKETSSPIVYLIGSVGAVRISRFLNGNVAKTKEAI